MEKKDMEAKVLQAVSEVLPGIDVANMDMKAELTKEYGVDSVSIIQLIVELEKEFDIEFPDEELALGLYYDMGDVVAAVAAKLS